MTAPIHRIAISALAAGAVFTPATKAHAAPAEPNGAKIVELYPRLHAAAKASPRAHAGRDVLRHGRAKDGRIVWAAVRRDGRRLWRELHPEAERARQVAELRRRAGTPATNRELGRAMAARRGWTGYQWVALDGLFTRESGWSRVMNRAGSGACHIPQALPCSKIPGGFNASPETAIAWGLDYIAGRYGSPAAAKAHSDWYGWY